ncbi:MAG: cytochrome c-550 PedF [Geminicoccaceae bacterium]
MHGHTVRRVGLVIAVTALLALPSGAAWAHGDVTPQAVDTAGLPELGDEWLSENPYRDTEHFETAVEIGAKAYNQNCARCHGLDAVSGGIAPDLRYLYPGDDDEYYVERYQIGVQRNGVTYMPGFGDVLGQEAAWAIRSYLDTVAIE